MIEFIVHGSTLGLAWFFIVNVAVTLAVAVWAHRALRAGRRLSATRLFAARVLPGMASLFFVVAVFVPSYWRYEPRDFVEGFDITLTIFALVAVALFVAAARRALRAWFSAARRTRLWMQTARPLALAGAAMPAFQIDADAPMLALVGVVRPRLMITRGLLDALTDEEIAASVAHEAGHSRAWDNLKRLLMRASPDLLAFCSAARAIECRWASAAEYCADSAAASVGPAARCALASALVKVARLTPTVTPIAEPISTLVDGGEIVSRVERLLADSTQPIARQASMIAWSVVVLLAAASTINFISLLELVHSVTEVLVRSVP